MNCRQNCPLITYDYKLLICQFSHLSRLLIFQFKVNIVALTVKKYNFVVSHSYRLNYVGKPSMYCRYFKGKMTLFNAKIYLFVIYIFLISIDQFDIENVK